MAAGHRILVAEDEPEVRNYLGIALECQGYQVDFAETGEEVLSHLAGNKDQISLVLMDIMMPRKDGMDTLHELRQMDSTLPVIMVSGASSPWHIVESMRNGAADFLPKPVSHDDLAKSIERAIAGRPVPVPLAPFVSQAQDSDELVLRSSWSDKIEKFLNQVANSDVPVLLQGETGVGKEILAHKLHARSPRARKPFLKLNCAALPSELVESELFGYERGAFTGALKNNPGKFEMANGGTILLDEIGDMDFKLQAKLLQVLQDKEFLRLGAREVCRVDVRVMAATHQDLESAIAEGRFREDLYYRLDIIQIRIPPLRERRDEVLPLAAHFVRKYSTEPSPPEIPRALRQALVSHSWPGNVRELENVMRKYLVLGDAGLIIRELGLRGSAKTCVSMHQAAAEPLPASVEPTIVSRNQTESPTASLPFADCLASEPDSILSKVDAARRQAESEAILNSLNACLWNRKEAAAFLKIDYKALLYKMKKLGIGEKTARPEA
jgi:two-component system, NtrC family, response regulator AtoC